MKYNQYHKFFFITKRSEIGYQHILKYYNEEVLSFFTGFSQIWGLKESIVQYLNKNGSSSITNIQYMERINRLFIYSTNKDFAGTLYLNMPLNPKFYSYF